MFWCSIRGVVSIDWRTMGLRTSWFWGLSSHVEFEEYKDEFEMDLEVEIVIRI